MIDTIEVGGNIRIERPGQTLLGVAGHASHGVRDTHGQTATVGAIKEERLKERLKHLLHRPLGHPVAHGEDGDSAGTPAGLGDLHLASGQWAVRTTAQLIRETGHLSRPACLKIAQGHGVYPSTGAAAGHLDIAAHPTPCQGEVLHTTDLIHEKGAVIAREDGHGSTPCDFRFLIADFGLCSIRNRKSKIQNL